VDKRWIAAVSHSGLPTSCAQVVDNSRAAPRTESCPQLVLRLPAGFHKPFVSVFQM
jgi:hypothetical protein